MLEAATECVINALQGQMISGNLSRAGPSHLNSRESLLATSEKRNDSGIMLRARGKSR